MTTDKPPTSTPIAKETRGDMTYHLHANSELWTAGEHAFLCGYVMEADAMSYAIDEHENEMAMLCAEALAEFGGAA